MTEAKFRESTNRSFKHAMTIILVSPKLENKAGANYGIASLKQHSHESRKHFFQHIWPT